MKMLFVYILKCSDDTYYTGITNNLQRRLLEHQTGYNPESYTHSRRPVELKYFEGHQNFLFAIAKEKQLKKWSKKKKEALIDGRLEELKSLSKKKFEKK